MGDILGSLALLTFQRKCSVKPRRHQAQTLSQPKHSIGCSGPHKVFGTSQTSAEDLLDARHGMCFGTSYLSESSQKILEAKKPPSLCVKVEGRGLQLGLSPVSGREGSSV